MRFSDLRIMVVIKCIVGLLQLCNSVKFYSGSRKSPLAKVPGVWVGCSLDNLEEILLLYSIIIIYYTYRVYIYNNNDDDADVIVLK